MHVDRKGAEKLRGGLQQKLVWATNKLMQDPEFDGTCLSVAHVPFLISAIHAGLFHEKTTLEAPMEDGPTVKRPGIARPKLEEILLDVKKEVSKFLGQSMAIPKTEKTDRYSLSSKVWYVSSSINPAPALIESQESVR